VGCGVQWVKAIHFQFLQNVDLSRVAIYQKNCRLESPFGLILSFPTLGIFTPTSIEYTPMLYILKHLDGHASSNKIEVEEMISLFFA
jgi:hypothetical protein